MDHVAQPALKSYRSVLIPYLQCLNHLRCRNNVHAKTAATAYWMALAIVAILKANFVKNLPPSVAS
jgi:hypothetical protein